MHNRSIVLQICWNLLTDESLGLLMPQTQSLCHPYCSSKEWSRLRWAQNSLWCRPAISLFKCALTSIIFPFVVLFLRWVSSKERTDYDKPSTPKVAKNNSYYCRLVANICRWISLRHKGYREDTSPDQRVTRQSCHASSVTCNQGICSVYHRQTLQELFRDQFTLTPYPPP